MSAGRGRPALGLSGVGRQGSGGGGPWLRAPGPSHFQKGPPWKGEKSWTLLIDARFESWLHHSPAV